MIKNELEEKKAQVRAGLKDDKGEIVLETTKILARWKEYVTALYADDKTQVIIKNERNEIMERIPEEKVNKIYETGEFPKDFLTSISMPIPKATKAVKCEEFRTISLISHASKILLHVIKERVTHHW